MRPLLVSMIRSGLYCTSENHQKEMLVIHLRAPSSRRGGTMSIIDLMIMGPLLLLATMVMNHVQAWPAMDLNDLSPPPGNSLQMKVKAYKGKQTFDCVQGQWKLINAEALLVDASGNLTTTVVGSYTFQAGDGGRRPPSSTWSLYNSAEEYAESGSPASLVSGRKIASEPVQNGENGDANVLLEATSHQYLGRASLVSYIQRLFMKVGKLPEGVCRPSTRCQAEVPFEAEFWLWRQDQAPPESTPPQLRVPLGTRLVEGFFGKGEVPYIFNGSTWVQGPWSAVLYDVPGGVLVGRHCVNPGNKSLVWEFFNPNGWGMSGRSVSEPVQVADNCMAWSLSLITSSWGNLSVWGPFTHVQMLSTRGGMPPAYSSNSSPLVPSASRPAPGDAYNSTFSAVFWFYS